MAAVSGRVRRAAALAVMGLMLSACSSGSQTASRDESPSPAGDPVELSTLDGEFAVTGSNPRLVTATGKYQDAAVSIEGDELKVRYEYPQEGGVGLAFGEEGFLVNGTGSVSCGSDECNWTHPGLVIPLSMTSAGGPPFPVVSMSDGEPPHQGCGPVSPGEEWVVDTVTDNSFSFVASRTGGGGDDPDCYRVVFDVEMTRA